MVSYAQTKSFAVNGSPGVYDDFLFFDCHHFTYFIKVLIMILGSIKEFISLRK